jgi:myosin heavy subunit
MDHKAIKRLMAKSPKDLTADERKIVAKLSLTMEKMDTDGGDDDEKNENLISELKEKAKSLLKELSDVQNSKKELSNNSAVKDLLELRKELKSKNKEIKEHRDGSDVIKTLTEKIKEEKELTKELRDLEQNIKRLGGGEFKIPVERKKRTSKVEIKRKRTSERSSSCKSSTTTKDKDKDGEPSPKINKNEDDDN